MNAFLKLCIYAVMYEWMYVRMRLYIHVCMFVRMYERMYVCMLGYMHALKCVGMYVRWYYDYMYVLMYVSVCVFCMFKSIYVCI